MEPQSATHYRGGGGRASPPGSSPLKEALRAILRDLDESCLQLGPCWFSVWQFLRKLDQLG